MSEENEDKEELQRFMEYVETQFFSLVEKGEDIRVFLYFPYDFLSDNIREYLDKFLMREAYKQIEKNENEFSKTFVVYEDSVIRIALDKQEQQLDLLKKMVDYFVASEEYENCTRIQKIMTRMENKNAEESTD